MQKCTFASVFAAVVLLFTPSVLFAQDVTGIKIQPSIIEERVEPGAVFERTLTVTNQSPNPATYYFDARNISDVSDGGVPTFAPQGTPTGYELAEWITIPQESVTLEGNASAEVPFRIRVPLDASPGSHFGGIFLVSQPPKLRETGAGIGYQVGTIVALRLGGEAVEEARIRDFFTDRLVYASTSAVSFTATIENLGNVIIRPRGPLTITNMFGKKIEPILRMNDDAGAVLPGKSRTFETTWNPEGFTFGRFEAIAAFVYGEDGRKTITSTVTFWVIPIRALLPIVVGTLALVLLAYAGIKLHVRRRIAEVSSSAGPRFERTVRRDPGISRLTVVAVALLAFIAVFLIILMVLFA